MRKVWIALLVILLAAGMAFAKDYQISKKAGDYTIDISMDKNPPVAGKNNIMMDIKDKTGKAVTDAKVSVDYGMPAMPGMPAMNYKTETMLQGSVYHATLNLSMSGSWNVTIKISRSGKTANAKFTIDAQ
jgi:YtkA-like